MEDDIPLEFATNTAPRLPCVVIVDGSSSMEANDAIGALNKGLKVFADELREDTKARAGVRLKVIRVGGSVDTLVDWVDAANFDAPHVDAHGNTPLGAAVGQALDDLEDEKARIENAGLIRNRAWLFILTDGEPTDDGWEQHAAACRQAETDKKVSVFCIGVDGANMNKLAKFSSRAPAPLDSAKFREFFVWLSKSASAGSAAKTGQTAQMASYNDWLTD